MFFSPDQQSLLHEIARKGIFTKPQVARLLPGLVRYSLENDLPLCRALHEQYGDEVLYILEALGSALMAGDEQANTLFLRMVDEACRTGR